MFGSNRDNIAAAFRLSVYIATAFAVLVMIWQISGVYAERRQHTEHRANQYAQSADRRVASACGKINGPGLIECVAKELKTSREDVRTEYDLKAQQDSADAAFWMAIISFLSLATTVTALWFVKATLDATREAVRDTSEATKEMRTANDVARDTATRQLRAYVYEGGFKIEAFVNRESGIQRWDFRPTWINAGQTPTRNLRMQHWRYLEEKEMPSDFAFDQVDPNTRAAILAPGRDRVGSRAGISLADVLAVAEQKKHFYLWGWAQYRDTLEGTLNHVTKFCYKVTVMGDTSSSDPNDFRFELELHSRHNCADEECGSNELAAT